MMANGWDCGVGRSFDDLFAQATQLAISALTTQDQIAPYIY